MGSRSLRTRQCGSEGGLPRHQLLCIEGRLAHALHPNCEMQAGRAARGGAHRPDDGRGLR